MCIIVEILLSQNQYNHYLRIYCIMTDKELHYLTDNIRRVREGLGYSQEYMAVKLGIGQNGYSKIELGYTRITVERLFAIARLLGVPVTELLQQPAVMLTAV